LLFETKYRNRALALWKEEREARKPGTVPRSEHESAPGWALPRPFKPLAAHLFGSRKSAD
jgi:hypothetical protein